MVTWHAFRCLTPFPALRLAMLMSSSDNDDDPWWRVIEFAYGGYDGNRVTITELEMVVLSNNKAKSYIKEITIRR